MDSAELSRKVAEAMGRPYCTCELPFEGDHKVGICDGLGPFDLADARDREAAIEWLNAKGLLVVTAHYPDGTAGVDISRRDGTELARFTWFTIEEAFGRAFLEAVKV